MIRHSSSFLISIIIHLILLLSVLFAWKNYSVVKKVDCDKKIHLSICDIVSEKELPKAKETLKQDNQKPEEILENEKQKSKKIEKKKKTAEIKSVIIPEKKAAPKPEKQEPKKIEEVIQKDVVKKLTVVEEVLFTKETVQEKKVQIQNENPKLKQEKLSKEYLKINTQKITKLLEDNLYYPRSARKRNITGVIIVKFTIGVDAKVYDIEIVESKSDILSRAAIKTLEDLSGVFPAPNEELVLNVPINYILN